MILNILGWGICIAGVIGMFVRMFGDYSTSWWGFAFFIMIFLGLFLGLCDGDGNSSSSNG